MMIKRFTEDVKQIRYALILLILYAIITQSIFHTVCPWAILTQLPCPGCGLTRAGICVLTLRFGQAVQYNATIYLWIPYLCYLIIWRYVLGKKPPFALAMAAGICILMYVYFGMRVRLGILPADLIPKIVYDPIFTK